jgi:hypothetical protein
MEPWCSDCKITIVYSEPSSPTSRSPPIDLPLPHRTSGTNLSSQGVSSQGTYPIPHLGIAGLPRQSHG